VEIPNDQVLEVFAVFAVFAKGFTLPTGSLSQNTYMVLSWVMILPKKIRVKRVLYVACKSRPGGNTMLVEQLSEADVLAIPSSDIANVLMDLVLLTRVLVGCPRPIQLCTMCHRARFHGQISRFILC